ncbi:MAG TPA: hypothetical protein VFP97_15845 [Chitinophagaceae bacterium]|nr:hypothetical protein [Chitinophagaceae bacterium]
MTMHVYPLNFLAAKSTLIAAHLLVFIFIGLHLNTVCVFNTSFIASKSFPAITRFIEYLDFRRV